MHENAKIYMNSGGLHLIVGSCHPSSWWRHHMETFSVLLVTGDFPSQRPVTLMVSSYLPSGAHLGGQDTIKYTIETPVIWDAIALIVTSR